MERGWTEPLQSSNERQALESAKLLLKSYPSRQVEDPEIYVKMIAFTFMEYSEEIHMEAIKDLTAKLKFMPTRADVVEICDQITQRRKWRKPSPEEAKAYRAEHPYLDRDPEWIPKDWTPKLRSVG